MPTTLITGGAGFLGSHLCERALAAGHRVVCTDNLITGSRENVEHLTGRPDFRFLEADVSEPFGDGVAEAAPEGLDNVLHFASPASPRDYLEHPLETLDVGSLGTRNCLRLAEAHGARFLLASTSEVYGDPLVRPQPESYFGNVNPIGPRSVYDEAKRFAEALTMAYGREKGLNVRIVRIFNTYGPRMRLGDGRVVPAFLGQALAGEPLTIFGDGSQTRSFCFVSDLVDGIWRLLGSDAEGPVNIGNPHEMTILEFAQAILELTGAASPLTHLDLPPDDPKVRRPDITRARTLLGWEPRVALEEGLRHTVEYFQKRLSKTPA